MPKRLDIDALTAFIRVAERKSFRRAADELGISPSAVSQMIKSLEGGVGTALLSRTTRSVGLTEAGNLLLRQARPAMDDLEASFSAVRAYSGHPSGLLRLNAARGAIAFLLEPMREFLRQHPDIEVELFADDGLADIVASGFDAGVRVGELLQPDMVAVRLSPPFRYIVAGSPDYFARHPPPQRPGDLERHRCIRFRRGTSGQVAPWSFREADRSCEVAVDGGMILNDTPVMVKAALEGLGLIHVPEPVISEYLLSGRLVGALRDCAVESPGLFLYYPRRNGLLPKLRALIDFAHARARDPARESVVSNAPADD